MSGKKFYRNVEVARFPGQLFLVNNMSQVDGALDSLLDDIQMYGNRVGIDFEWKPQIEQGEINPIATLQLCSGALLGCIFALQTGYNAFLENVSIVFQMLLLNEMPERLKNLLVDPGIVKMGHDLERSDIHKLRNDYHITMSSSKDLLTLAKRRGFDRLNLATLCTAVLGLYLNKKATMTDWSSPELTEQQIMYAATDAWVTRRIYLCLESEYWDDLILEHTGAFYDDSIRSFCCGVCDAVFSDAVECGIHAAEELHVVPEDNG
jgi:hypothetical protein